jgi:hypothetical protein
MSLPSEGSHLEDPVSATVTYDGKAKRKGAAAASAIWQIFKITYDANGNFLKKEWADGNQLYDNVWSNRASLTYA